MHGFDRAVWNREGCDRVTVAELVELLNKVPDDYVIMEGFTDSTIDPLDVVILDEHKEVWL